MEDRLFFNADALVSLTDAGRKILVDRGVTAPIEVIPCCADTDKFTWNGRSRKSVLRVVSLGSLGPGYCPEGVVGVFAAIKKLWPAATLRLVTRTDPAPIYYLATNAGVDRASIEVVSVHPEEVPRCLADADVGLCMIEPSFAKIASSPTKLAEYLASGIPVIANCEGIGDLGRIFGNDRVGVDLTSFDESGYTAAAARLGDLLADPLLSERCRAVACQSMSLESGVEKYWNLYQTCVRPRKLAEV
jgi:glycosyltransferase involved in cell wall biosynthesis